MASGGVLTIIEEHTHCTPCRSKDKKVAFNHYCIDCEAYYCNECFEFHLRIPYLAKHIVLKKEDVEVWSNLQYKCKLHKRNFEFFCRNDKKLCCHICVSLNHRACDKIDYIPECANDKSLKEEVTSMIRRIDNNSQNISTREEKFEKKSSANKDSEQCCQKTITDYRNRINAILDELETKTKDIIGKKFELNSRYLTENSEELRKFKCGLEKLNQQLHTSSRGKEILVYIGLLEGETFVEDVERKLSQMDIKNTKEDFELVLDDQLEGLLKSISSFGFIRDKQMLSEEISSEEDKVCKVPEEEVTYRDADVEIPEVTNRHEERPVDEATYFYHDVETCPDNEPEVTYRYHDAEACPDNEPEVTYRYHDVEACPDNEPEVTYRYHDVEARPDNEPEVTYRYHDVEES